MKKIFYIVLGVFMFAGNVNAQMLTSEEVENQAYNVYGLDKKKPKWEKKAEELLRMVLFLLINRMPFSTQR